MTDRPPKPYLPELDAIDDPATLRLMVRRLDYTLHRVVEENGACSAAMQKLHETWGSNVNGYLAALSDVGATETPTDKPN